MTKKFKIRCRRCGRYREGSDISHVIGVGHLCKDYKECTDYCQERKRLPFKDNLLSDIERQHNGLC